MKLKFLLIKIIGVTLMLITACSKLTNQVSVDQSSSGKQTVVAVNGSITIMLDSNETTGYIWELKDIINNEILQKADNKYEAPGSSLMGAGGTEALTFRTINAGKATINMEYSQPRAGGQKDAKSFT